jgi:hypothetical protein
MFRAANNDLYLEGGRKECFDIYHQYSNNKEGEWCNAEGFYELQKVYAPLVRDA